MKKLLILLILPLLMVACSSQNNNQEVTHIEVEATDSYKTEQKQFHREGKKIIGELYIPENSQEVFPLLIMSHGFGGNMDGLKNDAHTFVKQGYATFVFDFVGGGNNIKSDGAMTEMSVLTEARDLNVVIEELKNESFISSDHIFLLGQSQGGYVSTYVASTRNDIKGLLAFYPAYCIKDDALAQYPNADDVPDPYMMDKMYTTLGKIYYTDVCSIDIYEVMENYLGPTLLLHGTNDNVVPVSYARRASETFIDCQYIEIEGAGHGFSGASNERAISASISFLNDSISK